MSKKACKKKDFQHKTDARFQCKKCGARVKKKSKVCKPQKIEEAA